MAPNNATKPQIDMAKIAKKNEITTAFSGIIIVNDKSQ